MLKSILIVTISVLNLEPVQNAYEHYFDYDAVYRGEVSAELGAAWDATTMDGHEFVLMQPESSANVYLRFIENDTVDGYAPLATNGWNATELLVRDPDALATRLKSSPFRIIGPPKDLWQAPDAPRAMQAIGPGDEVLYLTRNGDFETHSFVDRVFIMVLGGPSMDDLRQYYGDTFGLVVGDARPFPISVLSKAQNRPADTRYPLATARISDEFLLELDEYPDDTPPRPQTPGFLPPGTAMVTFEYAGELDDLDVEWVARPRGIDGFPYAGRDVGVTIGAAGEWIELVELDDVNHTDAAGSDIAP